MIEVSVTAIKGGFRELYRTQNMPRSVAREIRHDSGSGFSIGKEAYSIFFITEGVVFSKCRIVTDGMGGRRVGNVNISIFIRNDDRLSGDHVVELLDELLTTYCKKYAPDNNLDNVFEDWDFVYDLKSKYDNKLQANDEKAQSGMQDAAYVYYSSISELQKYFDDPYFDEYNSYRQVFFVENRFENTPENPLNALRHDPNAKLRIDLNDSRYKLKGFDGKGKNGLNIEVWVSNDGVSKRKKNNDFIKSKDTIRIEYSKDNNKYFYPIIETGKISHNNIIQYLEFEDSNKIKVKNDVQLHKKVNKTISLEIKDRKGYPVPIAEITCKNESSKEIKYLSDNKILFEGEELKDSWTVLVKKGNMVSSPVSIIPENQSVGIPISLEKQIVTFQVYGNDGPVSNYKVQIKNSKGQWVECEDRAIEFNKDDIDKYWAIWITHDKYPTDSFNFCPGEGENPKSVNIYELKTNKSASSDEIAGSGNLETWGPKKEINAPKSTKYGNSNVPFYKKPGVIALSIVIPVLIVVLVLVVKNCHSGDTENKQAELNKINEYVNGLELNKDVLDSYINKYCTVQEKEEGFWQKIFPFGSNKKNKTSATTETSSPDYCKKLKDALDIRNALEYGKIEELKGKTYSFQQGTFKQVIDSIKEDYFMQIEDTLRKSKLSEMDLSAIANLVSSVQDYLMQKDASPVSAPALKPPPPLIRYHPTERPQKPLSKISSEEKTTFWNLVQSDNQKKEDYDNLFKTGWDYGNPYKQFYHTYLSQSLDFDKFKAIRTRERKNAKTLEDLIKLIERQ